MAIRMIVTDMDGTLLDAKNGISEANRAALKEAAAKGVHVAIATGRMHLSALPYAKEIGVTAPIVSCNGALVKTTAGEELFASPVAPDVVREILDCMKERGWYVQLYTDEGLFFCERDCRACAYEKSAGVEGKAVGWDGLHALGTRVFKLLSITDRAEETAARAAELSRMFKGKVRAVRSKEKYVDIMAEGVSKAASIERLAASLGISLQEVLALGDSDNDCEMLSAAGVGVAMATGTQAAREAADFLADNEASDGVARAVHAYVLEGKQRKHEG